MSKHDTLDRREFFKVAGVTAGAVAVGTALPAAAAGAGADAAPTRIDPSGVEVELELNGKTQKLRVQPHQTLAEVIRSSLGLTGTKVSCDRGACGACTVLLDGKPAASCMTFALDARGRKIQTIEGVGTAEALAPIQSAFVAKDALQCGFCTPGMVMSCHAWLEQDGPHDERSLRQAVSGNLCRCGTYPKVIEAGLAAAAGPVAIPELAPPATPDEARGPPPAELSVGLGRSPSKRARKIPEGEPRPWDAESKLAVVGQAAPRIDGPQKVTGATEYTFDVQRPGMLHAALVTSPHPHARVKRVDFADAQKLKGVRAVYTVERIIGTARPRDPKAIKPGLPLVRFEGQPVAAVAATTAAIAEEAARRVRVEYEVLPHTTDVEAARTDDAPRVYPGPVEQPPSPGGGSAPPGLPQRGNSRGPMTRVRPADADVEKALADSPVRIEGTFRTQVQTHSAMEPKGVVAEWKGDTLSVHLSTQGLYSVREELATTFELDPSKVRVFCAFAGGGFGAKFGAGNYGVIAANLARKAGAPVRLFYDRREEHLAGGNRPSSVQTMRLGAKPDGTLLAGHLRAYGSAGVSAGAGASGPFNSLYRIPVVRSDDEDVFTHAGPAAAFRAPGHPQGAFALEQMMDMLAEKLGMDPLALRDRNDPHPARREERRIGAERFGWAQLRARPRDGGRIRRGVGFAQGVWYNFAGTPGNALVRIFKDGHVLVRSGVQDIGGGIRTAMAQVVSEELGVPMRRIEVEIGDSDFPRGPHSGGSITTQILTPGVRQAAFRALMALQAKVPDAKDVLKAARKLDVDFVEGKGERLPDYEGAIPDRSDPNSQTGGAQFAEVEVDTMTGVVKVLRIVAVHDCGRVINRLGVESQIHGGVLQGISYALFEDRILDRRAGKMVNPNLEHYKILGSKDAPRIEPVLIEYLPGRTNTDAAGIGEPATVPTAGAIANAVYDAIRVRMFQIPITPWRVLAALNGNGKQARGGEL